MFGNRRNSRVDDGSLQRLRARVQRHPKDHAAWHELGLLAVREGDLRTAAQMFEAAVALEGRQAIYLRNLAEIHRRLGRPDRAIRYGRRAIRLAPSDYEGHYNLGLAYADDGNYPMAVQCYERALVLNPGHALSWNNLGVAQEHCGYEERALASYERALIADHRHALAHNNAGAIYVRQGRLDNADHAFCAALSLQPDLAQARRNLAALRACQAAAARAGASTHWQQLHDEGIARYRAGQFDQALSCYDQALSLMPDSPEVLNSKGFVLQDMGCLTQALACFEKAVQLAPQMAMARLNLGLAQLKLGDWANGWENYEYRWTGSAEASAGRLSRPVCPLPQWHGETHTQGRSLLVIAEQGFGDTFQFARYLPLAAERFRKTGFVCSAPTQRLLDWAMGEKIVIFTQLPVDYETWDMFCPMLSLPRAFGTRPDNIPVMMPTLRAPDVAVRHWRDRIAQTDPRKKRVGIAWAGRPAHQYDARRSLTLSQLAPLFKHQGISWFSLQKWETGDNAMALPGNVDWYDWTSDVVDFADTAALVSALDLVISIDSAVAHLAGSLNQSVWMLNRYDSEWRWLGPRNDSPWYPSMRIFNQTTFGDWDSVITPVTQALAEFTRGVP